MPEDGMGMTGGLVANIAVVMRQQLILAPLAWVPFIAPIAHVAVFAGGVYLLKGGFGFNWKTVIGAGLASAGLNYFVSMVPDLSALSLAVGLVMYFGKSLKTLPFVGTFFAKIPGL